MTEERSARIEQAITELEAVGLTWTNQRIYAVVGGSYHKLSQYLKARRADPGRRGAAVAVQEEPGAPSPQATTASTPAPPRPLLEQAQQRVATALNRENEARRDYNMENQPQARERLRSVLATCQWERRLARHPATAMQERILYAVDREDQWHEPSARERGGRSTDLQA